MFRSAALKLTLWYLAIIMALSLIFSVALYRISAGELNRSFRRQNSYFNQLRLPSPPRSQNPTLQRLRDEQTEEGLHHLLSDLLIFNLITLVLGGAASYALAKRTLHPIEEAMESQSRFTADASHELRTPLTAMRTEIEVALRNQKLSKDEAKALLQSNLEEVAKLRALSDALLRLASHEGNGIDAAEPVPLDQVTSEVVARFEKVAKQKSVSIDNQLKSVKIQGDRPSLTELVSILLDNAIKYSPAKTKITLSVRLTAKSVYLSVADQGEGISPEDLPHIFDRFYRADLSRSKGKTEGYGLGLSIAKKIADLHGGYIEASSAPGKGSTFTVKLPLA